MQAFERQIYSVREALFLTVVFGCFLPDFRPIFGAFLSALLLSDKSYSKHHLRSWRVLVLIQVIVFLAHG